MKKGKEKTNLYAFIQAQAESALAVTKSTQFPQGGLIGNMLAAFSCELYLKIILGHGSKELVERHNHNLKDLFEKLKENDRETIKEIYAKKKGEGYYVAYGNIVKSSAMKDFMNGSYSSMDAVFDSLVSKMRSRPPEEVRNDFKKLNAKESFLILLDRDKSAFIDSRYFYEESGHYDSDDFVFEFAEVLQEFVNNSKYRLLW